MTSEYECGPVIKLMQTPATLSLPNFRFPNHQSPYGSNSVLSDCMYSSPAGIFQSQPEQVSVRNQSNTTLSSCEYAKKGSYLYDNNFLHDPSYNTNALYGNEHNVNSHLTTETSFDNNQKSNGTDLQSLNYTPRNTSQSNSTDTTVTFTETPQQNSSCLYGNSSKLSPMSSTFGPSSSKLLPRPNGVSGLTHFQISGNQGKGARDSRVRKFKSARRNLRDMALWDSPTEKTKTENSSVSKGTIYDIASTFTSDKKTSDINGTLNSEQPKNGEILAYPNKNGEILAYSNKNGEILANPNKSVKTPGSIESIGTKSSCWVSNAKLGIGENSQQKDCKLKTRKSDLLSISFLSPPQPVGQPILYSDECRVNTRMESACSGIKIICNSCCDGGSQILSKTSVVAKSRTESSNKVDHRTEMSPLLDNETRLNIPVNPRTSSRFCKRNRNGHFLGHSNSNGRNLPENPDRLLATANFLLQGKDDDSSCQTSSLADGTFNDDTNVKITDIGDVTAEIGGQKVKVKVEKIEREDSKLESYLCFGCQKPVFDRYVLHVRDHGYWHAECLRCSNCQDNLSTHKTCYVKNEQVFCRNDYNILFGLSCVKCSLQFKKEQDWMRVAGEHRYHIACFLCKICKRQLGNNEKYHLVNGTDIYCTNHYRDMVSGDSSEEGQQPTKKAKRNRTSYTEAQIKFLQERFMHDSNPDGNELEKIANHINLKKRVVQVWFQNNRARLKKSANNTKGGNPENGGQSANNGRLTAPGTLHDSLAMDWDNSLDPSSLEDQGYVSPSTTPSQQQQQQQHHHQQQQLRSASSHFPESVYGMGPLMCLTPGHSSLDHPGDGPRTGSSTCGPTREQQLSPSFPSMASSYHTNSDPVASPSDGNLGVGRLGTNVGCDSGNGSNGDNQCPEDGNNNNNGNISNGTISDNSSHCLSMASPIASFRSSLCGDKPFGEEAFRRIDSRERHEQQIRQMMLYHEQQQQQQQQQQQYQTFGGPQLHLYGSFNLPQPGTFNGYSNHTSLHQGLANLCPSPSRMNEGPQNFLQLHQHQQHDKNHQHQQQPTSYQMLSPSGNDPQMTGNGNSSAGSNTTCPNIATTANGHSPNDRNNHLHHHQNQQQQQQQQHRDSYDPQVTASFGGPKTLAPPTGGMNMGVSTQSSPLPLANSAHPSNSSPSHFGAKRNQSSPDDFSKNDGYRSPIPFNARTMGGGQPYHFIPVSHAHRTAGNGYYGNGHVDAHYAHRADTFDFASDANCES